jgi:hypothetical protein
MRSSILACLGLTAALLTVSCAPTTTGGESADTPLARQCFNVEQVTNFRQGRVNQIFLRVGRDDVYEMSGAACRDLDFANRMAILPDFGSSSRLCTSDWARVVVPGSASPTEVCRVRISRKLTAEEVAALPGAHRP